MSLSRTEIYDYLRGANDAALFAQSATIRLQSVGPKVYLRGLIELSNRCTKDCLYCGIRNANPKIHRYMLEPEQVLAGARCALENHYGSVVMQAGEQHAPWFYQYVADCVRAIKTLSDGKAGITLSLGEQPREVYQQWFEAGAHRYLLRIESSSPALYHKIHPTGYSWHKRLEALNNLRQAGYQVGTGVMIGLPFQTIDHLVDDLLFLRDFDIDMCGMGPYIEHPDTPLSAYPSAYSHEERVMLTLRMIALLRIMMPDINIASTTALHALDPMGREKGVAAGANVLMPNVTPDYERSSYKLYDNKPLCDMDLTTFDVAYDAWGDSIHFSKR